MTGREHQAQEVVADVIVQCGLQLALGTHLAGFELVTELRVLALEQLAAAQGVDGSVLRGGHEPGARVVRDARLGPPLECRDERVVRQVLRQADVAHDAREPGDDLRRFDPPHRVDRAVRIGRRHRLASFCASRALTSFFTSAVGSGRSAVKRIVPLDVSYGASSFLSALVMAVLMKRLQ